MSRLIETIRLENGQFGNLSYHQHRLDSSLSALYKSYDKINLEALLSAATYPDKGLYKCRVTYDEHNHIIQYEPYTIRSVASLKRVVINDIDYAYKFANRNELKAALDQKNNCDDVLIIKDGLVTDTSYANIVFQNAHGEWITPSSYLLNGTMRQSLLNQNRIKERKITSADIHSFKKYKLINSMLRWDSEERDVYNIV